MIYLNHINSKTVSSVIKDNDPISFSNNELTHCFWEICEKYPEEIIIWRDKEIDVALDNNLQNIFRHHLIMVSYPIKSTYIPDEIGYIDQFPFVNPDYSVKYPTWRMSTDVGGIKASTALEFKPVFKSIQNFGYLINSIAKLGQQNSLFCYNEPDLVKIKSQIPFKTQASSFDLFKFISQHYKFERLLIMLFCQIRYHNKIDLFSFLRSIFKKSFFNQNIELSPIEFNRNDKSKNKTIDVIIPTIGRAKYVLNILNDLKNQSHLPSKVIIIEQDPDSTSKSQLNIIKSDWPFEIIHYFIHETGACNARNIGLENCSSDYIFLCDDDNHFEENLLQNAIKESIRLQTDCIVTHYPQINENLKFNKIKQWAAFGSGNAILKRNKKSKDLRFDIEFEFGYGEDHDFGWQLRNNGVDIIYHPELKIKHLKLNSGGFRQVLVQSDLDGPKPSVSMMLLIQKHYSIYMKRGYKISMFLKYYRRQSIKNPWKYLKSMKRRWQISEDLSQNKGEITKSI